MSFYYYVDLLYYDVDLLSLTFLLVRHLELHLYFKILHRNIYVFFLLLAK